MSELEKLLEPVAADNPCGEDLWLAEGRSLLQQPLDSAWRNGEQPKWDDIRETALEQLQRSRDLRIAVIFCLALLQTDGLAGFRDGMKLIRDLGEKFWDDVHPMPETPADQIIRANTLSNLSPPLGSDTPYQFVKYLRESALCRSVAGAAISLADVERSEDGKAPAQEGDKPRLTSDQIEAAFRAAPKDKLGENYRLVSESLSQIEAIDALVASKTGNASGVDFKALKETLGKMRDGLRPHIIDQGPVEPKKEGDPRPGPGAGGPAVPTGGIRSRADADASLAAICDYFRKNEPTSPVPLILERARRLLNVGFMEAMRDLAPDSVERFNSLFGIKETETKE